MKRPTIYDVAREAAVSASTVSRAYARPGRVNADTARAVFAAAERLGYRTSPLTAQVGQRTGVLALVVPDISNPFYAEIVQGAEEAAQAAGYSLLVAHTRESPALERELLERSIGLVEAVVLAGSRMTDSAIITITKQRPTVLLNRQVRETSCVVVDSQRGMRKSAEHIAELGHRSVTYLAGPPASWAEGVRWSALRAAARDLSVRVHRMESGGQPTIQAGYRAARIIGDSATTAVLAYNDALAIGLVKGLQTLGVRVPHDVSVVGFDNILLTEVLAPALTTVAAPIREVGSVGLSNALALASGARSQREPLVLPVRLVVRESTRPPAPVTSGMADRTAVPLTGSIPEAP